MFKNFFNHSFITTSCIAPFMVFTQRQTQPCLKRTVLIKIVVERIREDPMAACAGSHWQPIPSQQANNSRIYLLAPMQIF